MNLWRTTIEQGSETFAWTKKVPDGTPLTATLNGTVLPARPWTRYPQWYTPSVMTAFQVPATVQPGVYPLENHSVRVVAPLTPRPWVMLQPGEDIQAALATGYNVLLEPGQHELRKRLDLVPHCTLRGSGRDNTTIVRIPDGDYAERMIGPAPFATVSDLTLVPAKYAFHGSQPAENVRIDRVRFQGGEFGEFPSPGLLVHDCLLEEIVIAKQTAGLWLRCRFWRCGLNSRGTDGLYILDCDFENGGINFGGGVIRDSLFHACQLHGTQGRDNGSEVFLVEGEAHLKDCLISGLRIRGGEGVPIQVYKASATNNLVFDFVLEGGGTTGRAIWFYSTGQHEQSGNLFVNGELRGGRVDFGDWASGNTLRNVGVISPRPGRGNQLSWQQAEWYGPQTVFQAAPETNNLAEACPVVDMPCGWRVTDNVTLV